MLPYSVQISADGATKRLMTRGAVFGPQTQPRLTTPTAASAAPHDRASKTLVTREALRKDLDNRLNILTPFTVF